MDNCKCKNFCVFGITCGEPNVMILNTPTSGDTGFVAEARPNKAELPNVGHGDDAISYSAGAAKVPAWYPFGCDINPPVSSAVLPEGDGKWTATLRVVGERVTKTPVGEDPYYLYGNFGGIFTSRGIWEDGEQTEVVYAITPINDPSGDGTEPTNATFFRQAFVKDHVKINIATQNAVVKDAEWRTSILDWSSDPSGWSMVDNLWSQGVEGFPGPDGTIVESWLGYDRAMYYPAQCISYGKDNYCRSSFIPSLTRRDGDAYYWAVSRLKYSDMSVMHNKGQFISKYGNKGAYGDYLLMLPSVRVYLQSTADQPDEPWWCAVKRDGRNKLVVARWLNNTMRDFSDDSVTTDPLVGLADGTIAESEVTSAAQVIVDAADPPSEFPGELWKNIQVLCYQHVNGIDVGIFITDPDEEAPIQSLTSDFGVDGDPGPPIVPAVPETDHGLKGGLHWESIGDHGDSWSPEIDGYYSDPPDYSNIDPYKVSLRANSTSAFVGEVSAVLRKVQWADTTPFTFDFRFDNSTREVVPPFRPTNFPATDTGGNHDELQLWINGVKVWWTDGATTEWINGTSVTTQSEPAAIETFWDWYGSAARYGTPVSIPMTPGEKEIRFVVKRVTSVDTLHAWIDNVSLKVMVGNDPNGVKPWIFFNDPARPSLPKVYRAKDWKWPRQYAESSTPPDLSSRVSPIPEFIAYDWLNERLYLGNPHYTVKMRTDAGHEMELDTDWIGHGIYEWTASPNIPPPAGYEDGDCAFVEVIPTDNIDTQLMPAYGRHQILIGKYCIQLRGCNSSLRDASGMPIPLHLFPKDETFIAKLNARFTWSQRAHAWSLSHDGKKRLPHVELLMKPYWDAPAFPAPPPYTNPGDGSGGTLPGPWPDWMEADSEDIPTSGEVFRYARWRDPRRAPRTTRSWNTGEVDGDGNPIYEDKEGSYKPQWTDANKIVPRSYSDSTSRSPQFTWIHNNNPNPTEPGDDGYPPAPWPSAQYKIMPTYMAPYGMGSPFEILKPSSHHCPQKDPDTGAEISWHYMLDSLSLGGAEPLSVQGPYDFEAVFDAECVCGCQESTNIVDISRAQPE